MTDDCVLLYEDECHIRNEPVLHATWHEVGKQKRVGISGTPKRYSLFGAVNEADGDFSCMGADTCNAESFQSFLAHLLGKYSSKHVVMVLDNARYHHARVLQPFLNEHRHRLTLLFLPPYSPNLNRVERIWKWLKNTVLANCFYPTHLELKNAIDKFLDLISSTPDRVLSRIAHPHMLTY